jgi:uroporphyrinogen decarboxylase
MALPVHLGQSCATRWKDKDLKVLIKQKDFVLAIQEAAHCKKNTDTTILFTRKVKAGVDAGFFDSWGGMLSPVDYQEFSWKYINQIIEALADHPVIVF